MRYYNALCLPYGSEYKGICATKLGPLDGWTWSSYGGAEALQSEPRTFTKSLFSLRTSPAIKQQANKFDMIDPNKLFI